MTENIPQTGCLEPVDGFSNIEKRLLRWAYEATPSLFSTGSKCKKLQVAV